MFTTKLTINPFLIGDFNAEDTEACLTQFLFEYDAKNIISEKHALKVKTTLAVLALFITNSPNSFQNTSTITTGLSDFHKIVITVLKAISTKSKSKVITYRDFKRFNEEKFKTDFKKLKNSLRITNHHTMFLKKSFLKFRRDMLRLKTKQSVLIMPHMSQL